jgi:hypothetical protein
MHHAERPLNPQPRQFVATGVQIVDRLLQHLFGAMAVC